MDAAANLLAGIGTPVTEALVDCAADSNEKRNVRSLAFTALGLMDPGQLSEHVWRKLFLIQSRDAVVQKAVTGIVGRINIRGLEHAIALLDDTDNQVRTKAFAVLVGQGRSTLQALAAMMDGPLRVSAERIVQLLVELNRVEPVQPWLVEHLSSKHRDFRRVAVATFDAIGDPEAVPVLLSIFNEDDPELRKAVVRALGHIGNSDVVAPLLNMVRGEPSVRSEAVRALLASADPKAVEHLAGLGQEVLTDCAALLDVEDGAIRERARQVIAAMTVTDLVPLHDLLVASTPKRDTLVAALAAHGARIVPAMIAFIERSQLQQAAIHALRTIVTTSTEPLAPHLLHHLHHPDRSVRKFAIDALGDLRDPRAAAPLQALLTEKDPDIVGAAGTALIKVYSGGAQAPRSSEVGPDALRNLLDLSQGNLVGQILKYDPSLLRELLRASHTLEIKGNQAVWSVLDQADVAPEQLLQYLTDPDPAVASAAAQALAVSSKASTIVPSLIAMLGNFGEDATRREAAAEALGYIGDHTVVVEPLLQYLDVNPDAHRAAKHALVRIGERAAVAIERHRNAVSVKKLRTLNPVYDELLAQIRSGKDDKSAGHRAHSQT